MSLRLLVAALVFGAWISLLRPTTPVYFAYALLPILAGLVALGLWLVPATLAGRAVVFAFSLLAVSCGVAVGVRMAETVRHGEGLLTSQVLDIKEDKPRLSYADTWFPASGREALGRLLCAQRDGVALHGHLAFVVDRSVGVDALFACGTASHVALGGRDPGKPHWVGISRQFWSRAGGRGECRVGSLQVLPTSTLQGAGKGLPLPDGRRYFPREHAKGAMAPTKMEFSAPAGHALLVTNMLHGYEGLRVMRVQAGGKELAPVAANDLSFLYLPPAGSQATVSWVASFEATNPAAIDVVTFAMEGTCGP